MEKPAQTITPDQLTALKFLSDPVFSPDGTDAVVVMSTTKLGENDTPPAYEHRIYRVDLTNLGEHKQRLSALTQGTADTRPSFSPDGATLAFIRKPTDGSPQIATLPLSGGEATVRTSMKAPVTQYAWRDNTRILFISAGDEEEKELKPGLGRIVRRRLHKLDGVGFPPAVQLSLWELDLSTNEVSKLHTFTEPPMGFSVRPDGAAVAFTAPGSADERDMGRMRAFTLALDGASEPVDVLGKPVRISQLAYAGEGNTLLFTAEEDLEWAARTSDLWLLEPGSEPERITEERELAFSAGGDSRLGRHDSSPRWLAGEQHVRAVLNERGRTSLVVIDPNSGELAELAGGNRVISGFSAANHNVLFLSESPTTPTELRLLAGGEEYLLCNPNADLLAQWELPDLEERLVEREDGAEVAYYIHHPKQPRADRAVIVQIHGGPHTHDGFGFRFEYHVQAANGYTVLTMNPRGSSSFGSAHGAAILHQYGTIDADDIHSMVDHYVAHSDHPDAPVHVTGGSYGGFMTNWLTSHSNRFRSAITDRSICNWISFYGTADIGPFFGEVQIGAIDYANPQKLWDQSPLKYVENVVTPTLIVHSEEDYRCPIEQAEQWHTALKTIGKAKTRFVRFPGESHGLSREGRPDRRIQRIELALEWFAEHA